MKSHFKLKTYLPLLVIFSLIFVFTIAKALITTDYSSQSLMLDFRAGFFLVFGGFKAAKLGAFAEAYAMYDIIAMRSKIYAHIYPFIEIALGLAFLFRFEVIFVAWITLLLMSVNSVGAYKGIRDKKVLMCACLGSVFKLPMSFVSLGEDLLMAVMALFIILMV